MYIHIIRITPFGEINANKKEANSLTQTCIGYNAIRFGMRLFECPTMLFKVK